MVFVATVKNKNAITVSLNLIFVVHSSLHTCHVGVYTTFENFGGTLLLLRFQRCCIFINHVIFVRRVLLDWVRFAKLMTLSDTIMFKRIELCENSSVKQ